MQAVSSDELLGISSVEAPVERVVGASVAGMAPTRGQLSYHRGAVVAFFFFPIPVVLSILGDIVFPMGKKAGPEKWRNYADSDEAIFPISGRVFPMRGRCGEDSLLLIDAGVAQGISSASGCARTLHGTVSHPLLQ